MQNTASNLNSLLFSSAHGVSETNNNNNLKKKSTERINRVEIFRDASCCLFTFSRVRDLTEFMMLHVISNLSSYLSFVFWGVVFFPPIWNLKFSLQYFLLCLTVQHAVYVCGKQKKGNQSEQACAGPSAVRCHPVRSHLSSSLLSISSCLPAHAHLKGKKNPYISSSILSFLSFYNIFRRTSDQIPIRSWLMNAFFITCMVNMFAFKHLALNGINSKSRELYL